MIVGGGDFEEAICTTWASAVGNKLTAWDYCATGPLRPQETDNCEARLDWTGLECWVIGLLD
jgi:hypothetical protein